MADDITVSFRLWRRPPGATGRAVFRRPAQIEVDSVELMPFAAITPPDVRRSGERDRESLRKRVRATANHYALVVLTAPVVLLLAYAIRGLPVGGRHRMNPVRAGGDVIEQRLPGAGLVALGIPAGRNRSSPHQMSRCRQSTASRAGAAASSASTRVPMPPPVSTRDACPRTRGGVHEPGHQPGRTALASSSASRRMRTWGRRGDDVTSRRRRRSRPASRRTPRPG